MRTRAGRDEQRLQSGGLPAKELEGLQHEIATLARRQCNLEDELLEVMEQREQAEAALADCVAQRTVLDGERAELTAARDAAFAEIDAAVAERGTERAADRRRPPGRPARALRAGPRARRRRRRGDAAPASLRGLPHRAVGQRAVRGAQRRARRGRALRQLPPDPRADRRVRAVSPGGAPVAHRSVVVEADGGSRGNPGPAGYGAVVLDPDTDEVLAERQGVDRRRHEQRRRVLAG